MDDDDRAADIIKTGNLIRGLVTNSLPTISNDAIKGRFDQFSVRVLPPSEGFEERPKGVPDKAVYVVTAFKAGGSAGYSMATVASTDVQVAFLDANRKLLGSRQEYSINEVHPEKEHPVLGYVRACSEIGTAKFADGAVLAYPASVKSKDQPLLAKL